MTGSQRSLGLEGGSHLQSLALFLLDAGKTVLCSLAGLRVGHAEHVVSLDSAVHTRVARDWLAQLVAPHFLLVAVEGSHGLGFSLVICGGIGLTAGGALRGVLNLGVVATEEGVHGCWGDWLLQN